MPSSCVNKYECLSTDLDVSSVVQVRYNLDYRHTAWTLLEHFAPNLTIVCLHQLGQYVILSAHRCVRYAGSMEPYRNLRKAI